ncbi:unnamed protein product [Closterium sp. Naga37s-1]|nr:unnamed protein product [Closterium sp. Naga37s-1]
MDGGDDSNSRYTVDEALSAVGFGAFHWLLLGYAGLAWAAEAMELLLLSFIAAPAAAHWGVGGDGEAALSSVVFAGMLVGAFAWGLLADSRGRRFAFTATALLTFLAALLSALAPSFPLLLAARALVGVGLGGAPVIFSLFLEFTPPASRGFWSLALSLFWTVGSVAEAALAWAVLPVLGWRWLIVLSSLPLLLLLLLFPLLPESPRYLLVKSRPLDAMAVLQHVARLNRRALPAGQVSLVAGGGGSQGGSQVEKTEAGESEEGALLLQTTAATAVGAAATATAAAAAAAAEAEAAARDAVERLGQPFFFGVLITSAAELPGLLLSALIVDRVGRRTTIAAMLAAAALAVLPLLLHSLLPGLSVLVFAARPAATVAALFVARAAIMGSFQTLFMFAPELYATSVRSSGLGFASSFSRLGGIVCPYVAVTLVQGCQLSTALSLFVAVPLTAAIATTFFPVETARRALIEVHVEEGEYGGQNDGEISRKQGVVKDESCGL